jgi:hypothetical protein
MNKSGPFAIEPLDDDRWARVEQKLFAELDAIPSTREVIEAPSVRRPQRHLAIGGALLAAAAILLAVMRSSPKPAVLIVSDPSEPASSTARASVHSAAPASTTPPEPTVAPPPARRAVRSVAPANTAALPPASAPEPLPSPPVAASPRREAFDDAARLEVAAPADALARYHALAAGNDTWAANALFAEARLALERGDRARGEQCLHDYLSRFPTAPNAGDARDLLARGRR